MSDDLDDLKSLMNAATPHPDAARKSENLALAQKNFADLQGSRDGVRLTSDRPKTGIISGVRNMLSTLTSRAGLTASTAIVAVGLVMLSPLGNDLLPPPTDTAFQTAPQPVEPSIAQRKTAPVEPAPQLEVAPMVATEMASDGTAAALPPASPALMSTRANGRMMLDAPVILPENITETFANADTNPIQVTAQNPVSTFSIDVDTASYSVIRNSLSNGQLPPKDAVRVEEMINYFPYDYAAPTGTNAFQPTVTLTPTPWNADTQLMQIAIQGALPDLAERPPLNLVFLIDTSGSMEQPNKLPLLKQSFRLMLGQLRPEDQVAIVTYAGSAGEVLAPTAASERTTILNALDNLGAGGSTAGQAGLQQAYATAAAMSEEGDVNRIILATDGDFNVGLNDPDALKDYIADKRDSGTYLSVLGFGRGNLDDATMQALAQNGNGQAAYIDTLSEAQKVLVDQLGGALFPIADDVKIQVEFNPATVSEYRLIGYETRALKREDFNNDKVDAGDIGAGHQVTAIYEVTPKGSPAERNAPLRYDTPVITQNASDELAFLRLRYKAPGSETSALIETPIQATITGEAGFAAAIAGFGHLLRDGTYTGDWTYADAIKLANDTKGDDPFGYRAEAVQLMRLAESLSAQ
ncbi:VWA domain-containing protein [Sulfitobacter sp. M57]|uniref:vWA domain-containing protein n=2 Tax=Sulfitobacter TaxID=60136 RepID=UPI0023E26A3B|nr:MULTISPECIES: VWA domain-containing protein [unclassified Sulfitobacter]MDF3414733.1 VWA domain-containing protein [Sulfitobacter sp. KE5]MDF3422214.1 VWA domain-containing protein [Sulfitobacter sp. KE43]MDF3433279.1 VWA domain-containing protein [Sulfitobacter sp. KE42]MDF3458919.1 VWA domain-containing protein [Sulfitobacter sp. S74]MDF3462818.1 VWA domain-containing protein [Sulfitobacter sp. Ks18]